MAIHQSEIWNLNTDVDPDDSEFEEDPDLTPLEPEDPRWDVFVPDDDQSDPLPEPGDFWVEPDAAVAPSP